ncbi:MAG: DUF3459 domain-containing protein [Actinobacteria bacterium]|nr:DUF3459 domain-containing protein [Actinomycetota bacterium]
MTGTWWQHGTIYQIYPRSFSDSDGDGVGDLPGITARLDYLNDGTPGSLGVDAIWLSPFYPSPMADFGYDVSDYTGVHELFGTLDDFDELVAQAHRRGIRVVIDWVPNHTSDRHPWFQQSRSSRDDPRRDWYVWRDPAPDGGPPNNWLSAFPRAGRAWTWDEPTAQWYLHSFLPEQPDLNWDNPQVEAAMHDTLRFWLERGVDGFRIDVAHRLGKDPELPDVHKEMDPEHRRTVLPPVPASGPLATLHDQDWPTGHDRLRAVRRVVEDYGDRVIIGEVYLLDQRRLVRYVANGDELHLAHNFVFVHQPWKAAAFRSVIEEFETLATPATWPAWFLNNHDHSRTATRYAEGAGDSAARARVAGMLVLTLRGTPFLYQGEELGLPDGEVPPETVVDVDGRDPQRTPIPWEPPSAAGPGAGFTTGTPWLPVQSHAERLNVATQSADPASTLSLYRRLLAYRRDSEALREGAYRALDAGDDLLVFLRGERVMVALNFSADATVLDAAGLGLPASGRLDVSTDAGREPAAVDLSALRLGGDEGVIVRLP